MLNTGVVNTDRDTNDQVKAMITWTAQDNDRAAQPRDPPPHRRRRHLPRPRRPDPPRRRGPGRTARRMDRRPPLPRPRRPRPLPHHPHPRQHQYRHGGNHEHRHPSAQRITTTKGSRGQLRNTTPRDLTRFRRSGLSVRVIRSERGWILSCVGAGVWLPTLLSSLLSAQPRSSGGKATRTARSPSPRTGNGAAELRITSLSPSDLGTQAPQPASGATAVFGER